MIELAGLRVLIVEDEGLVAMLIEEFLEELGCVAVAVAARLDDALQKAQTLEIDAALLDVNLAGQLSYPVAELLVSRRVPFVFATGYGPAALPETLRGTMVLPKPFLIDQLARALLGVRARNRD